MVDVWHGRCSKRLQPVVIVYGIGVLLILLPVPELHNSFALLQVCGEDCVGLLSNLQHWLHGPDLLFLSGEGANCLRAGHAQMPLE